MPASTRFNQASAEGRGLTERLFIWIAGHRRSHRARVTRANEIPRTVNISVVAEAALTIFDVSTALAELTR